MGSTQHSNRMWLGTLGCVGLQALYSAAAWAADGIPLTLSGLTARDKVYDGNTIALVSATPVRTGIQGMER